MLGWVDYLPEPSIRNIEIWLDWQACQLDMPHWWVELTAIPSLENPTRLAQKICTSFLIPAVRCETFSFQEYTAPSAPKCLTRNMFLPDDPSYQDIWQQPLLLTMAYTWVLQYWAEKFRLPAHPYSSFGDECHGTNAWCEGAHHLLQMRCLRKT